VRTRKTRRTCGAGKGLKLSKPRWPAREPIGPTLASAAYGHNLHSFAQFRQSLSRLQGESSNGRQDLRAEHPCFPIRVIENIIFLEAIFFLTVVNVMLYSKYAMALDHSTRTLVKRLSGGL
jgi:hypothetical protein